ncbi:DnaD domain-containing protein [Paenibacillus sp. 32O-W]|uniref:DnaD domain-containing protein n=1 Tax=Paenibacillus sp. 32O-W TaxID=1695218 RepID=UPI0011A086C7|nr:DnaD domain protein [Paenibacillus sp. 32O-W]
MDHIVEMSAFIDWLEINPLEPTTQTLWFHLMQIANKSGYPEWFTVANTLLQAKVGVTENTLIKHRNVLVQKGRIEYKSQGKQKAGKYKIISFTSINEVNSPVNREVNHAVKREVKGSALLKDINSSSASSSDKQESFYAAHIRVFGFECNPFQAESLSSYIDQDGMDESVVIRAIERAGTAAAGYNFNLIKKILDDYFKSGVRTLPQAIALDEQFDARKKKPIQFKSGKVRSFAEMARGIVENDA